MDRFIRAIAFSLHDFRKSGVDAIALCANTAHLFADKLEESLGLPFTHIVAETGKSIKQAGFKKAALLGTKFTMEMDFYRAKCKEYGIEAIIPQDQATRDYLQHTIKNELGPGYINPETKSRYIAIVDELVKKGVYGNSVVAKPIRFRNSRFRYYQNSR